MNLADPLENMRALLKARASLDGSDTVTRFAGTITMSLPGGTYHRIFGFDGYNVARAIEVENGFDLLTREAVFYTDPRTGLPIDTFDNPVTGASVEIMHIFNDPVNQRFRLQNPWGPWRAPYTEMAGMVLFQIDVHLAYPSPLPRAEFPEESQSDTYVASELFGFHVARAELDADTPGAPATVSWTRVAPWLPFLKMADRPGHLIYHGHGAKLPGGYADLPAWMRERVEEYDTGFRQAPRIFTEPNATSWTVYRSLNQR